MNPASTKVKTITNTKLIVATIFLGAAAFAAAGAPKGAGCLPKLMNVALEKNTLIQGQLNNKFESTDHSYTTRYKKGWGVTTSDFDNFTAPIGTSGVSMAVPAALLNGGPGMVPPPPTLKKTTVLISGYHAEWIQRWDNEQCIELGEIKFLNGPPNWRLSYQGTKDDLKTIKAMVYSIRFLKNE